MQRSTHLLGDEAGARLLGSGTFSRTRSLGNEVTSLISRLLLVPREVDLDGVAQHDMAADDQHDEDGALIAWVPTDTQPKGKGSINHTDGHPKGQASINSTDGQPQGQATITSANDALVQFIESQQDPRKKEDNVLHVEQCKGAAHFRRWRLDIKAKLARSSSDTDACYAWLNEIEKAEKPSDLRNPTKFRSFDDKLAAACKKIATGKAAREIKRVEHELEREDKLMGGREMLKIIYDCFTIHLSDQLMIDWRDMQAVKYRGDLARFHTEWLETLLDLKHRPDDMILHDWYKENIEKGADLKLVMQQYEYKFRECGDESGEAV